jgi:ABC-type antimicrobial peptide transport system permease subunit
MRQPPRPCYKAPAARVSNRIGAAPRREPAKMRFVRFLLILLGILAFVIAAAALAAEIVTFARDGKLLAKPLGRIWREWHLLSLQLLQVGIERHLGFTWLWQSVLQPMLLWPPLAVSAVFAVLGYVLVALGRAGRRHPRESFVAR